MTLQKEQRVFRNQTDESLKSTNKAIRNQYRETRQALQEIALEYQEKFSGQILSQAQKLELERKIATATSAKSAVVASAVTVAMDESMDTLFNGFTFSYSKVSDSYLKYKPLSERQKRITRLDKINGKTYLDRLDFHSKNLNKKTAAIIQNGLRLGLSNQQIARNLNVQVGIDYNHSLTIARTETGRVGSWAEEEALQNAVDQGLVIKKRWVHYASQDPRSDHVQMDGVVVDADEDFKLPSGASGPRPRMTGNAADDINCHCSAIEFFEGFEPKGRRQGRSIVEIDDYDSWWKSGKGRKM